MACHPGSMAALLVSLVVFVAVVVFVLDEAGFEVLVEGSFFRPDLFVGGTRLPALTFPRVCRPCFGVTGKK